MSRHDVQLRILYILRHTTIENKFMNNSTITQNVNVRTHLGLA